MKDIVSRILNPIRPQILDPMIFWCLFCLLFVGPAAMGQRKMLVTVNPFTSPWYNDGLAGPVHENLWLECSLNNISTSTQNVKVVALRSSWAIANLSAHSTCVDDDPGAGCIYEGAAASRQHFYKFQLEPDHSTTFYWEISSANDATGAATASARTNYFPSQISIEVDEDRGAITGACVILYQKPVGESGVTAAMKDVQINGGRPF